jgi:phosphatidylglycerol:prolipoprotein diacylglycerol transferase
MRPLLFEIPVMWYNAQDGWYWTAVPVRAYGFMVMLGCLAAAWVAIRRARRERIPSDHIWDMWMWALLAGFVGARTLYVLQHLGEFRGDWLRVLYIWEGGLAFQGGLVLAIVVLYLWFKIKHVSAAKYFDVIVAAVILGYAFARVGCFLNGCCHGHTTGIACAVTYPAAAPVDTDHNLRLSPAYAAQVTGEGRPITEDVAHDKRYVGRIHDGKLIPYRGLVPREPLITWDEYRARVASGERLRSLPVHPAQLYACGAALLICFLLWMYDRVPRRLGQRAAMFLMLYAVYRFINEFLRGDTPPKYGGLTVFQVACIGLFVAFAGMWLWCQRKMPRYVLPERPPKAKKPAA